MFERARKVIVNLPRVVLNHFCCNIFKRYKIGSLEYSGLSIRTHGLGSVPRGDLFLRRTADWTDWVNTLKQLRTPVYNAVHANEFYIDVQWLFALPPQTWLKTQGYSILFLAIDIFKHYLERRDESKDGGNTTDLFGKIKDGRNTDSLGESKDGEDDPTVSLVPLIHERGGTLVFLTCVWIAMKVDSSACIDASEFLHHTGNLEWLTQLLKTELKILNTIQFNVQFPTAHIFIKGISFQLLSDKKACKTLTRCATHHLKMFFMELVIFNPLHVACACVTRAVEQCFGASPDQIEMFLCHLCTELEIDKPLIFVILARLQIHDVH